MPFRISMNDHGVEKRPKVSVCVTAYNHERYIRQCLQSIVDQEADFDFEVVVGDDCSTDGTRAIIEEFADKYPAMVRTIFQEKNMGGTKNYFDVHGAALGEYIAHVDGDDYCLPGKLKRQVEILDINPNIAVACHFVKVEGDEAQDIYRTSHLPRVGNTATLVEFGSYFAHSSKMYRAAAMWNPQYNDVCIDLLLHIEHSRSGGIYLDDRYYGVYRHHEMGTSKLGKYKDAIMDSLDRAYDRAIELGVDRRLVERARYKRRCAQAMNDLVSRDYESYKKMIVFPLEHLKYIRYRHVLFRVVGAVSPATVRFILLLRMKIFSGLKRAIPLFQF